MRELGERLRERESERVGEVLRMSEIVKKVLK